MKKVKYVFVVLVYKNILDLQECIESIQAKVKSNQIIVVNVYFDDKTMQKAKEIADKYFVDFINIDNKGYSFGNNRGIEYARKAYDFEFVIVSNPDVTIEKFNDLDFSTSFKYDIIAPEIISASGRKQNPMAITQNLFGQWLEYMGFKYNLKYLTYIGILISKIIRCIFLLVKKNHVCRIFGAHGSFVILSRKAVNRLYPIYDENIFLFAEESVLAMKARKANLLTCYYPKISINHKEDGSMKLSNLVLNDELKKANIYYYEHYVL